MLIDRRTIRAHAPWLTAVGVLLLVSLVWYSVEFAATDPLRLPGGSSRVGFVLGLISGIIFLFEFLYWPRRSYKVRATWRFLGRSETWLRAHIWLGLVTLPLLLMHSGLSFGGWFTTIFSLLYLAVYVSGIFGLVMQQIVPRLMLAEIPEETIHSQIEPVMKQHLRDAERLVAEITGNEEVFAALDNEASYQEPTVTIGSPRRLGTVREKVRNRTDDAVSTVPHTEALVEALRNDVSPFLSRSTSYHSRLGTAGKAAEYFAELRRRVPPAAADAVTKLESICTKQRQLRKQQRYYFWLHSWLVIHLPLSVALMILLVAHVVTALRYSGIPLF